MNRKNLYVLDVERAMSFTESKTFVFADCFTLCDRICRKEITKEGNVFYSDLESGEKYFVTDNFLDDEIVSETIVPLTDYYNFLGFPKKNVYENREVVNSKVKQLRKMKKI